MKIAVIIQGSCINNIDILHANINNLKDYIDPQDIYISTWNEDLWNNKKLFNELKRLKDDNNIKVVLNKPILDKSLLFNNNNFVKQSVSSYNGIVNALKFNSYDYIIKLRSNAMYKGYNVLIDKIIEEKNKIVCSSSFFRNDLPYHPGDHIIAGKTSEIYDFFNLQIEKIKELGVNNNIIYSYLSDKRYSYAFYDDPDLMDKIIHQNVTNTPPEIKFCVDYLINKIGRNVYKKESHVLMKKYFSPIDINKFDSYYYYVNSIKCEIYKDDIDLNYNGDIINFITSYFKEKCKCKYFLCKHRAGYALMKTLFNNTVKKSEDLIPIVQDDITTYCKFVSPYTL